VVFNNLMKMIFKIDHCNVGHSKPRDGNINCMSHTPIYGCQSLSVGHPHWLSRSEKLLGRFPHSWCWGIAFSK